MNERSIFLEALEQPTPERREAFLAQACGDDATLRRQIDDLLQAHDDAGSFIEHSPAGFGVDGTAGLPQSGTEHPTDQFGSNTQSSTHAEINLSFLSPSVHPEHLGRLGAYEVLDVIGRGAFGIVLRALDPKLNRVVAIKVLLPELAVNAMSVRRFLKEAQAAAAVSHDHVVTIHAVDDTSPLPFLVMECILGQSLQNKISQQGALSVDEILRIGIQVASGLAAAHKQGLVHRDIKPGNILLENSVQRVKITDFGLARSLDDLAATQTFQVAGTPQYMSPEQAHGNVVDQRSDLFSLGSVLYFMCTGRSAFRADSIMAALKRVCEDTPRPIRESNPEIPDWLCDIVTKLLEKKPENRYQTAAEVAGLLETHLAEIQQNPSRAIPTIAATTPQSITASRTKRSWLPVAAVLLAFVIGLSVIATVQLVGIQFSWSSGTDPKQSATLTVTGASSPASSGPVTDPNKSAQPARPVEGSKSPTAPIVLKQQNVQSSLASATDRAAAEWVLSVGSKIDIRGEGRAVRPIRAIGDLPAGPLELTGVFLSENPRVGDADLAIFKECKNIIRLVLDNTKVTKDGLANFKQCQKLQILGVGGTQVGNAGLAHFQECKELVGIWAYGTLVSDDALVNTIKELPKIRILHLVHTRVSDTGLAHLNACKDLTTIALNGCNVGNAGLEQLANCPKLAHIHVSGTRVTDVGLAHLKACPDLATVELNGCQVSDVGLKILADFVKLDSVSLEKTNVTEEGVKKLSAALPKCTIRWNGGVIEP